MKIEIKNLPKSQKELIFSVEVEEMDKHMKKAAAKIAQSSKFDGFRQGKAPEHIVYQQVGEHKIFDEAIEIAIDESYREAIEKNNLMVLGHPRAEITKAALGNPLEFKIIISILPEVKLGDYKKISGKLEKKEVTKSEVEKELKVLQKKRAKYITKDEAAQKGDRIEIDFESRMGDVKVEGGESKNHPLIIGEGKFVPGFEDKLIGIKKDETKEFDIVFPKDYHKKELADKNVNFKVTAKIVQKAELPELNDEFAKSLGKFDTLDILKKSIEEGMIAEENSKAQEALRIKLIDAVKEKTVVEIPDILIDSEINSMMHEFKHNVEHSGLEFETYLLNLKTTEEKLKEEWKPIAESRVKTSIVLREISKLENITATDKEIEDRVNESLKFYPNEEEIRKNIDIEKYKDHIAGSIINERVFEFLEKIAAGNGK